MRMNGTGLRSVVLSGLCVLCPAGMAADGTSEDENFFGIEKVDFNGTVPADRPRFADSVRLVPKGYFVAEGGMRVDGRKEGGTATTIPASFLLRTGVTEDLELRLGFEGYEIKAPGNDGATHASAGIKARVHDETTLTPAIDVLAKVSLPTGNDALSSSKPEPQFHFIWGKELTERFGIGGDLNFAERIFEETGNYTLETASAVFGHYSVTDRVSTYLEYYTILRQHDERDTHAVDTGITFLPVRQLQLDAYIGTGLNDASSDIYGGVGIARLF